MYSFRSTSTRKSIVNYLRKGGLQIFSWFTNNVLNTKVSEQTHPYVIQCFDWFDYEQQMLGKN